MKPLIPYPKGCIQGKFLRRYKRFFCEIELENGEIMPIHSNNSGSMLGLLRKGARVLASYADNPKRKLAYTQEAVWIDDFSKGFWVGVNTLMPNRILEQSFNLQKLPFARGYSCFRREVRFGNSRLDGLLSAENTPNLWIECKSVTLVEDGVALFPDAQSERGQKHLRTLLDIVRKGERAAMFYVVQRPDAHCFAPASIIDPVYAKLFYEAREGGVLMYAFTASVSERGIDLGNPLPILPMSVL